MPITASNVIYIFKMNALTQKIILNIFSIENIQRIQQGDLYQETG